MGDVTFAFDVTDEAAEEAAKLLRCHAEGLRRITRVIDGNPNYDAILAGKVTAEFLVGFSSDKSVEQKIEFAIKSNKDAFRSNVVKTIYPKNTDPACFGTTRNNLKEFEFFDSIFQSMNISGNNLAKFSRTRVAIELPLYHFIADIIERDIERFYKERHSISANVVHQQISYSRTYLGLIAAFLGKDRLVPSLFVISNDHMPVHVAASMVMKALSVPRVYMQHAEVSDKFPPLDFEVSVLRSAASFDTYKKIGTINGAVFVLPRYRDAFKSEELGRVRDTCPVVIYPTARVLLPELRDAIVRLRANPLVEKVFVKPHPASMPKLQDILTDVEFVNEIPADDHVAIVGNSSIAVDLLYQGVPVYQLFDFDPVERDYYRLVAEGITLEVARNQLATRFWAPYVLKDEWRFSFERRRPVSDDKAKGQEDELISTILEIVRSRRQSGAELNVKIAASNPPPYGQFKAFAKFVAAHIVAISPARWEKLIKFVVRNSILDAQIRVLPTKRGGAAVGSAHMVSAELEEFIAYSMSTSASVIEWLSRNHECKAFSDIVVVRALEGMFQRRDPSLSELWASSHPLPDSPVGLWARLKSADWSLEQIPEVELRTIADQVYNLSGERELTGILEGLLLSVIQRSGDLSLLQDFFSRASVIKGGELSINRQIALLRTLSGFPAMKEEADRLRLFFEQRAHGFHLLKFKAMDVLEGKSQPEGGHAWFVDQFIKLAPDPLADEFRDLVSPVYGQLQPRMRYMDVRSDPVQSLEVKEIIKSSLQSESPFSLLRLSDGEGYLFGGFERGFNADDVRNRERHWWGTEVSDPIRKQILDCACSAVSQGDILGIPSVYRFIRDHTVRSSSLLSGIQGRGLVSVLHGVEAIASEFAIFTEDKVNVALFQNARDVADLVEKARKTVLVSSVKPDRLPGYLSNKIETILVPTHHRTSTNNGYHSGEQPLPYVYKAIMERVESESGPGVLVLIAAGIIGKCFVGAAKEKGAVSLDIGSVIDDWSAGTTIGFR